MIINIKKQKKQIQEDQNRSLYLDLPIPEQMPKKDDKAEKTIPRGVWEIDI